MASFWGDDGGTFMEDGRRRRTNAGYTDPSVTTTPFGMPGTETNPNTGWSGGMTSLPPSVESTPQTPSVPTQRVSSLMEGDPTKLSDPNHIAQSPKYQFLSLAPFYGRGQENDLLKQLQSQYGQYWNGWNFDGKGNFIYGGNPNALNPAWGGVTSVDAYGGYGDGGALRARWGVEDGAIDPFAMAAGGGQQAKDPFGSLPSWMTDGLTSSDLIRLAYNTYIGRDPSSQEIAANNGNGSFTAFDPRILNSLEAISRYAEAEQYKQSHPGYTPPPAPSPAAFGNNSSAVGQALQRLSMALPQLTQQRQQGQPVDPLMAWIQALLGVG